jgi:hypothetical protein
MRSGRNGKKIHGTGDGPCADEVAGCTPCWGAGADAASDIWLLAAKRHTMSNTILMETSIMEEAVGKSAALARASAAMVAVPEGDRLREH